MYSRSRLYYDRIKSRSPNYLNFTLEGLRKSRPLNYGCGHLNCLTSKKIRINWSHRLF